MKDYKLITIVNPYGWIFAELPGGKRITKDMISFDVNREDIIINENNVVLFYNSDIANHLLNLQPEIEG